MDALFPMVMIGAMASTAYRADDQAWANAFIVIMIGAARLGTTWEIDRKLKKHKEWEHDNKTIQSSED